MKNRKLNPWGAAMIIGGIVIAVAAFFGALWQHHPDPSAFKPRELAGLRLRIFEGRHGFECEDTGAFLPLSEVPVDAEDEQEFTRFVAERAFVKGRLEIEVVYIMLGGLLLVAAGAVLCSSRGG